MLALPAPGEVAEVAAGLGLAHPWLEICATPGLARAWGEGRTGAWRHGRALLMRAGTPWHPREPVLFGLGDPADLATLVRAHGVGPATRVMLPAERAAADPQHTWQLRVTRGLPAPSPGSAQPPAPAVGWLEDGPGLAAEVDALLDLAMPEAAVRPGDPMGGRWCGARDDAGRLLACAAQTLPVAPIGHLSSLATHPRARGLGIGSALTRFFVAEELAAGAPLVMLGVNGDNVAADRLYDHLGFERWPMTSRRIEEF